jgi:hypothetical protein
MTTPRHLTPDLRNRAPLPAQVCITELSLHEIAEFIEPTELPNVPFVSLDIADYEPEHDG